MVYETYPRIRKVVDTLIDGTFSDGGTGMFQELYDSLLKGASWHKPDHYYLLLDFLPYCDAKLQVNADYRDNRMQFIRKCFVKDVYKRQLERRTILKATLFLPASICAPL